jgi:hypothetical protein
MAAQVVASRAVLSSTDLVIYIYEFEKEMEEAVEPRSSTYMEKLKKHSNESTFFCDSKGPLSKSSETILLNNFLLFGRLLFIPITI